MIPDIVGRSRAFFRIGALALPSALALMACGAEESAPPAAQPKPAAAPPKKAAPAALSPEEARAEATALFQGRCATCHGSTGQGDGPASVGLNPKPRNFQEEEWQSSVSDEHLRNVILYGGGAVGLSPAMPGNPDLIAKTTVVDALIQHIRDL